MEALLRDDLPSEDSEDTAFDPDGEDAPDGAELLKEMEMVFGEEDDGEEDDGEFPGLYGSDEGDDGSDGSDDDDERKPKGRGKEKKAKGKKSSKARRTTAHDTDPAAAKAHAAAR